MMVSAVHQVHQRFGRRAPVGSASSASTALQSASTKDLDALHFSRGRSTYSASSASNIEEKQIVYGSRSSAPKTAKADAISFQLFDALDALDALRGTGVKAAGTT